MTSLYYLLALEDCFSFYSYIYTQKRFTFKMSRLQAIIWTNAGILLIRTLGTDFSEISSEIKSYIFIQENTSENVACEMAVIFTRGQFWPSGIVFACGCVCVFVCLSVPLSVCLSVCQWLACPHDNSVPVQARITKFGPTMQKTFIKVPFLWSDRPWPSRSNSTLKSEFTPFWACPHHISPPIPIVLGGNWPWPSRSNMT